MMNNAEQVKKLYEDAVLYHMLDAGYSENSARVKAQRISNIIVNKT